MRVAIDATALGSGRGGDETYLRGLLAGIDVARDVGDTFPLFMRADSHPPALPDAVFPVRRLGSDARAARYLWELPRAVAREKPRVDLLLGTNHLPLRSSVPRALIVHDLSFHHRPDFYPARTRWRLSILVRLHVRQAQVILTGSEFSRRDLISTYRLPEDRVHVVPPVIDPAVAAPDAQRLREQLGVGDTYFLYVGNLHPRKNLTRLVAAFQQARAASSAVRECRLVIAGAPWFKGHSVSGAAPGSDDAVMHVGRVTDMQRDALLRGALALAYPSLFEGIGLPPLEAMAAGAPVLAARSSSLPEVLGDAALFVDPLDTEEMAAALRRLAEDRALRDDLTRRGLRWVEQFNPLAAGRSALRAFRYALRTDDAH